MYRDKLQELVRRSRHWDQHPDLAPLDALSWPSSATVIWSRLSRVVHDLGGTIATPRTTTSFVGPIPFFSIDGQALPKLYSSFLVRAYPLIDDDDALVRPGISRNALVRPGISRNALAAVVVAAYGARATPMLVPVLDDSGVTTMMMLDRQPPHALVELLPKARAGGQQPATIIIDSYMETWGESAGEVAARVALRVVTRLERMLPGLPFRHGMAGAFQGMQPRIE